jgi:Ran GTPase-activating protein (RanGAP) involved in mRNA processing and transport
LGARGNQFSENAAEALAKFLVATKTLAILDLSNAGIPEALQKNIAAAVVQNAVIQRVRGLKLNLNTAGTLAEEGNTFVPKSVNAIKSVYR